MLLNINRYTNVNSYPFEQYSCLWKKSCDRSPYTGPSFLKSLSKIHSNVQICAYLAFTDALPVAAAFFRYDSKRRCFVFLSEGHTDHNVITVLQDASANIAMRFCQFVLHDLNVPLYLKNVPQWTCDRQAWQEAAEAENWTNLNVEAWINPVFESKEEGGAVCFSKHFKRKRLQTYFNKLKCLENFEVQVQTGTEQLREWIHAFCMNHESKWNQTKTPSSFMSATNRELLLQKAFAWAADESLVRFGFRAEGRLICSVICLKQGNRLIYMLPSYAADYEHTHCAQVMVSFIGQWAGQNGFTVLDFGVGAEEYKLRFASNNYHLYRIFLSPNSWNLFTGKARIEIYIRNHPILRQLWETVVLKWYRQELIQLLSNLRQKAAIQKTDLKLNALCFFRKLSRKFSKKELYYQFLPSSPFKAVRTGKCRIIDYYELLEILERDYPVSLSTRNLYCLDFLRQKRTFYGWFVGDRAVSLASISTSHPKLERIQSHKLQENKTNALIWDCYTPITERGNGYYTALIRTIAEQFSEKHTIYIYTNTWNRSSQRGIQKAGFFLLDTHTTTPSAQ